MANGVLEGLRVLDFGRYIAGPFCATQLADLGADVIRIERVGGGEDRYVYPVTDAGDGSLFLQMNRNKRGIELDVKSKGGGEVLRRLTATADVVVANLPEDTLRDMGLDYESLKAIRPDIILTSISAFGPDGPYAGRVGFDGIGQSMSGAVWMSGQPGEPMKSFASWVDFTAALLASQATLAALLQRNRTGEGQEVRASLFGAALTTMNFPLIEQALNGADRQATGNRAQSGGPSDVVRTQDGWIIVQVIGMPLFRRWARLMGETHWLDDPRFATDSLRSDNGAILSERTAAWAATLTTSQALDALAAARVPAGPVLSPRQVLDDPHVRAAGIFTSMDYPGAPELVPLVLDPALLTRTPQMLRRRAPLLGEHTDEVLGALAFTPAQIEALRVEGAV
jgi:crotonobetainyl-CoA:carnitine CoA-transferase CaiB-like acyl-CoA transferase